MKQTGRPPTLTPEQLAEIITLSTTKNPTELAQLFNVDRTTIYYHLKKAKKDNWKKRPREKVSPQITKTNHAIRQEKINQGKNYKDYLAEENGKRKTKNWYAFKITKFAFSSKKAGTPRPPDPIKVAASANNPETEILSFENPTKNSVRFQIE